MKPDIQNQYEMGCMFGKLNTHPDQLLQEYWIITMNHARPGEMPKILEDFADFKRGVLSTNRYDEKQLEELN